MPHKFDTPTDVRVARRAAEQYGVVAAAELAAEGLGRSAIRGRVRAGRLHRVHQGVYAVGHAALSLDGRFMAATLACGPRSWLGYRSCSAHWEFMAWDDAYLIEVVVEGCAGRSRPGLRSTGLAAWIHATSSATAASGSPRPRARCSTSPTSCPRRGCAGRCVRRRRCA